MIGLSQPLIKRGATNPLHQASAASPEFLGLHKTLEMVAAPKGRTFFYRSTHKRVINVGYIDSRWLDREPGPTIYTVTDGLGVIRYVGKHEGETPLRARWFRHGFIHHQQASRARYIEELDGGRGPLMVWSAPVASLLPRVSANVQNLPLKTLVAEIEAVWIRALRPQLWNRHAPASVSGLTYQGLS